MLQPGQRVESTSLQDFYAEYQGNRTQYQEHQEKSSSSPGDKPKRPALKDILAAAGPALRTEERKDNSSNVVIIATGMLVPNSSYAAYQSASYAALPYPQSLMGMRQFHSSNAAAAPMLASTMLPPHFQYQMNQQHQLHLRQHQQALMQAQMQALAGQRAGKSGAAGFHLSNNQQQQNHQPLSSVTTKAVYAEWGHLLTEWVASKGGQVLCHELAPFYSLHNNRQPRPKLKQIMPFAPLLAICGNGEGKCVKFRADATAQEDLARAAESGDAAGVANVLARAAAEQLPTFQVDTPAEATGYTPLIAAIVAGHKDAVAVLLQAGARAQPAPGSDHTPLRAAALFGRYGIASQLLAMGADPNARSKGGLTAIMGCCFARDGVSDDDTLKVLEALLLVDADDDDDDEQEQESNAQEGDAASANDDSRRPRADVDVDHKNDFNETALFLAVAKGKKRHAELLRRCGARLEALSGSMRAECHQQALAVATDAQDRLACLLDLGAALAAVKRFSGAVEHLEQAVLLAGALGDDAAGERAQASLEVARPKAEIEVAAAKAEAEKAAAASAAARGADAAQAAGCGASVTALATAHETYSVRISDGAIFHAASRPEEGAEAGSDEEQCLVLASAPGTFALTPASRLTAMMVAAHAKRFVRGRTGIDWGCGSGCLALLLLGASRAASSASPSPPDSPTRIFGLDYEEKNVKLSKKNAAANGFGSDVCEFHRADSRFPRDGEAARALAAANGVDFIVANPPESSGDDGFSYRRRVLRDAVPFLRRGSFVAVQAPSYYGIARVLQAASACRAGGSGGHYRYLGIGASSEWMELDAGDGDSDLRGQLQTYANVEAVGGGRYYCGPDRGATTAASSVPAQISNTLKMAPLNEEGLFMPDIEDSKSLLTAQQALEAWEATKLPPLCQWQVHMFVWE